MDHWLVDNFGMLAVIVGWAFACVWWARGQEGRLDATIDRLAKCETNVESHSDGVKRELIALRNEMRDVSSQLNQLIGQQHGRRSTDRA